MAILTDSGGFQVFSLNELRKVSEEGVTFRSHLDGSSHFFSPESAMEAQIGLGADIIMAFDECTEYPADGERARQSMELTLRWAARSKKYFEQHCHEVPWRENHVGADALVRPAERSSAASGHSNQSLSARLDRSTLTNSDLPTSASLRSPARTRASGPTRVEATQALFGIVQGGMDAALRKESAERTIEIGFPGYAIGGLSVGEPRVLTREIVETTLEHLPADQPRYLMGVGTPEEIVEYANLGIDMMDCVLPTRAARHGLLFTSQGRISIKQARFASDQGPAGPGMRLPGVPPLLPGLSTAPLCRQRGFGPGPEYCPQPQLLP